MHIHATIYIIYINTTYIYTYCKSARYEYIHMNTTHCYVSGVYAYVYITCIHINTTYTQVLQERARFDELERQRKAARFQKHYHFCRSVVDQLVDLTAKTCEYRAVVQVSHESRIYESRI